MSTSIPMGGHTPRHASRVTTDSAWTRWRAFFVWTVWSIAPVLYWIGLKIWWVVLLLYWVGVKIWLIDPLLYWVGVKPIHAYTKKNYQTLKISVLCLPMSPTQSWRHSFHSAFASISSPTKERIGCINHNTFGTFPCSYRFAQSRHDHPIDWATKQ